MRSVCDIFEKNVISISDYAFLRLRQLPSASADYIALEGDVASRHMRFPMKPSMWRGELFNEVCVRYFRKNTIAISDCAFLRFRQLPPASVDYLLLACVSPRNLPRGGGSY